jgi:phosphatidylethanolamine/phosphatidyl-N-methylethanolamine N-methyltransferase
MIHVVRSTIFRGIGNNLFHRTTFALHFQVPAMRDNLTTNLTEVTANVGVASVADTHMVHHNVWKERSLFLLNFLKNPMRNASVIPSSKTASRAIVSGIDWDKVQTVVELGPGNGTFTNEIIARSKPGTHIILIELEETYVDLLRHKYGNRVTVVHDSAHRMNEILKDMDLPKADLIVSSLPFLQKQISRMIFAAILEQTKHGAAYRFFTYMPPVMKWFYRGLPLHKVKYVFNNIPPMWIYGIN